MPNRDRLSVSVPPGAKDEWKEFVEEDDPYDDSLSQLIRRLVEREIAKHERGGEVAPEQGGESEGSSAEVGEKIDEILQNTQTLDARMSDLEARLSTVERELRGETPAARIKNDVFAALPSQERMAEHAKTADPTGWVPEEQGGPLAPSGRPDDIAKALDELPRTVEKALDRLTTETARVQETDDGRYYKEV